MAMPATRFDITTQSPEETAALAEKIGQALRGGDTILLSGPIGAGKSHFCRHLIQSRLSTPEDVPSPTFTLVQIYEAADTEIWHSDLYRLANAMDSRMKGNVSLQIYRLVIEGTIRRSWMNLTCSTHPFCLKQD